MKFTWIGLGLLFAVLVIGDRIRVNRPAFKYRLTVAVETPQGLKSASGVLAVHPDRNGAGRTRTKGDALVLDLGTGADGKARDLVVLLAHGADGSDGDGVNYVAMRAYKAAGRDIQFRTMSRASGVVPVTDDLVPDMIAFADIDDPGSARRIQPGEIATVFGEGFRWSGMTTEVVPNGLWPLDFGGPLGEPVTRGIESKLPWWGKPDHPAARALDAAGLKPPLPGEPEAAFTRK
jgi:hypothetical protein